MTAMGMNALECFLAEDSFLRRHLIKPHFLRVSADHDGGSELD